MLPYWQKDLISADVINNLEMQRVSWIIQVISTKLQGSLQGKEQGRRVRIRERDTNAEKELGMMSLLEGMAEWCHAMSRRVQAASKELEKTRNGFSLQSLEEIPSCRNLDFSPWDLFCTCGLQNCKIISLCCFFSFFFFFFVVGHSYLFIYFWLCWVFVSVRGLSLVEASGGHSSSRCTGLSLSRPLLLRSTGSRRAGSVVVAHGLRCSAACGIFPDQGSNPCPLHWQADSQPLRHQGSPSLCCLKS